jgi:hypothetical protein
MSHFEPTVPQPQPQSATQSQPQSATLPQSRSPRSPRSLQTEPDADWHRNHIQSLIDIRKDTNDVNFFIIYNLH